MPLTSKKITAVFALLIAVTSSPANAWRPILTEPIWFFEILVKQGGGCVNDFTYNWPSMGIITARGLNPRTFCKPYFSSAGVYYKIDSEPLIIKWTDDSGLGHEESIPIVSLLAGRNLISLQVQVSGPKLEVVIQEVEYSINPLRLYSKINPPAVIYSNNQ